MALKPPIVPSGVPPPIDWIPAAYSTTSEPISSYPNAVKAIASWKKKEEEARSVLETSVNFIEIYLVLRYFRFQNPDTAAEVLSRRSKLVLDSCLNVLHGNRYWKLSCECNDVNHRCKASDIMGMCRRQRPAPVWDEEWIVSNMDSTVDVATIAQKLDHSIYVALAPPARENTGQILAENDQFEAVNEDVVIGGGKENAIRQSPKSNSKDVKRPRGRPLKDPFSTAKPQAHKRSRVGCLTCKRKKMKCDETKPSCNNCEKRHLSCEGYPEKRTWASKKEMANTETHEMSLPTTSPPFLSSEPNEGRTMVKGRDAQSDELQLKSVYRTPPPHARNPKTKSITPGNTDNFLRPALPPFTRHNTPLHIQPHSSRSRPDSDPYEANRQCQDSAFSNSEPRPTQMASRGGSQGKLKIKEKKPENGLKKKCDISSLLNPIVEVATSTASSSTTPCGRSTDTEASREGGRVGHDLVTAAEQTVAMAEGSEDSRPLSLKVISLSAHVKRPPERHRMHPLPGSPQLLTQKVRTKTGCETCRKRKKKCDESKPSCLSCTKLLLICNWSSKTVQKSTKVNPEMNLGKSLDKSTDVEQAKSPTEGLRSPLFYDPRASFSSPFEPHTSPERVADNLKAVEISYRRANGQEGHKVIEYNISDIQCEMPRSASYLHTSSSPHPLSPTLVQSVGTTVTPTASFPCFRKLPPELQNLIWGETLPEPRVFDRSTLKTLNPRNGIMYSYLTPYALGVCRDSRAFANSRLCRAFLFQDWSSNLGRTIYFNPTFDVCVYRFTDLSCKRDFIPRPCSFRRVEIIANLNPDIISFWLRCTDIFEAFPSLEHLLIREREANLVGTILKNGWKEARWNEESKLRQDSWDAEWKLVQGIVGKRGIELVTSQEMPKAEGTRKVFMSTFPAHNIPPPDRLASTARTAGM